MYLNSHAVKDHTKLLEISENERFGMALPLVHNIRKGTGVLAQGITIDEAGTRQRRKPWRSTANASSQTILLQPPPRKDSRLGILYTP